MARKYLNYILKPRLTGLREPALRRHQLAASRNLDLQGRSLRASALCFRTSFDKQDRRYVETGGIAFKAVRRYGPAAAASMNHAETRRTRSGHAPPREIFRKIGGTRAPGTLFGVNSNSDPELGTWHPQGKYR